MQGNLNIIHIACGYEKKKLYKNLFNELADLEISQEVIAPYFNKIVCEGNEKFTIIPFQRDIGFFKRLMFFKRTKKLLSFVQKNLEIDNKIIHAHSLFSDGAVAYFLKRRFGIPYVVAVRNTDINIYFKYFFLLRKLGFNILRDADRVLFLSPAYKNSVLENIIPNYLKASIADKSVICPNGIDEVWLQNKRQKYTSFLCRSCPIKLMYVGEFQPNKNIHSVVKAINILNNQGLNISFTAFGQGKNDNIKYVNKLVKLKSQTFKIEKNLSPSELISLYRDYDIFIMPSFTETFGLVYVESLTQGLPIIYSAKQGFDGFFEEGKVGYSVNPRNVNDIIYKIELIIKNHQTILNNISNMDFEIFRWENIAKRYRDIYETIKQ